MRLIRLGLLVALFLFALGGLALAHGHTPLDDAGAKVANFAKAAGTIMTGLIPTVAGLAVAGLAVKRSLAKAMGEEESMVRANNQITEVLKLTAIGTGASLLVAVAGGVLA